MLFTTSFTRSTCLSIYIDKVSPMSLSLIDQLLWHEKVTMRQNFEATAASEDSTDSLASVFIYQLSIDFNRQVAKKQSHMLSGIEYRC